MVLLTNYYDNISGYFTTTASEKQNYIVTHRLVVKTTKNYVDKGLFVPIMYTHEIASKWRYFLSEKLFYYFI